MRLAPRNRPLALLLPATLFCLAGCSGPVYVSGAPVTVGPEWTELPLAEEVAPQSKRQEIWVILNAPGAKAEVLLGPPVDRAVPRRFIFPDGRAAAVSAELRMRDGTTRPLVYSGHGCARSPTCSIWFEPNPALSRGDVVTAIRVRSTDPLEMQDARWVERGFGI